MRQGSESPMGEMETGGRGERGVHMTSGSGTSRQGLGLTGASSVDK